MPLPTHAIILLQFVWTERAATPVLPAMRSRFLLIRIVLNVEHDLVIAVGKPM